MGPIILSVCKLTSSFRPRSRPEKVSDLLRKTEGASVEVARRRLLDRRTRHDRARTGTSERGTRAHPDSWGPYGAKE